MRRFTKGKWHTHIHDDGKENMDIWVSMSAGQKINASCHRYRLLCNCQHNQYWQQYQHDRLCLCHVPHCRIVPCVLQCNGWYPSYDLWYPCSPYPNKIKREKEVLTLIFFGQFRMPYRNVGQAGSTCWIDLSDDLIGRDLLRVSNLINQLFEALQFECFTRKRPRSIENIAGSRASYIPFW